MAAAGDSFSFTEAARETSLMRRVGAGDRAAFAEVMGVYRQRVWAVAFRFTRRHEDADDMTQEAFLRLWKAAARWEPTARLGTWLYRVTANLCMDHRGKKSQETVSLTGDLATPSTAPSDALEAQDIATCVQRALAALPERQRLAVILHRFDGLSYEEMAKVTQWSEAAIESLLSRAYASLRKQLTDMRMISK
jgi:RNA polymerase sigma-70 factor, ECF subfamily